MSEFWWDNTKSIVWKISPGFDVTFQNEKIVSFLLFMTPTWRPSVQLVELDTSNPVTCFYVCESTRGVRSLMIGYVCFHENFCYEGSLGTRFLRICGGHSKVTLGLFLEILEKNKQLSFVSWWTFVLSDLNKISNLVCLVITHSTATSHSSATSRNHAFPQSLWLTTLVCLVMNLRSVRPQ